MIEQQIKLEDVASLASAALIEPGITSERANHIGNYLKDAVAALQSGDEKALRRVLDLLATSLTVEEKKIDKALEPRSVGDRELPNISEINKSREWAEGLTAKDSFASVTGMQYSFATQVNAHTFTYRVAGPTTEQTQEDYIRGKLGNDAQTLIDGLKSTGVDVAVGAPKLNEATLDTKSAGKARSDQNAHYQGGLADPIQATNIAIEAFCAAKKVGLDLRTLKGETREEKGSRIKAEALKEGLDEGTATVLEKLTAGVIRIGGGSGSGALYVTDVGRLYAHVYYGRSNPSRWAFGARPAPESKI